jgi:hypothetical protein
MLAMLMALFMTVSAQAQIVSKSVKVCVDYDVEFTDANSAPFTPSNPQNGIGDHWDNNEIDRVAIGMEFQILSDCEWAAVRKANTNLMHPSTTAWAHTEMTCPHRNSPTVRTHTTLRVEARSQRSSWRRPRGRAGLTS